MRNKTFRRVCGALLFAYAACLLGGYGIFAAVAVLLLAGVAMDPLCALSSSALYLLAGIWLPVYPDSTHGLDVLFGARGGFLLSLLFCTFLIAALRSGLRGHPILATLAGLCVSFLLFFGIGILWQAIRTEATFSAVLNAQVGKPMIRFGMCSLLALFASPSLYRAV